MIYLNLATNLTKNLLVHVLNRVLFCFAIRSSQVQARVTSKSLDNIKDTVYKFDNKIITRLKP